MDGQTIIVMFARACPGVFRYLW